MNNIYNKSQLEVRHNTNVFLNPQETINQQDISDWDSVAVGEYGYDWWKKVDASTKRQPIEETGYIKKTVYAISYLDNSGTLVSKQITSPESGDWDNTDLDIPIDATEMKLELGHVGTQFVPDRAVDILLSQEGGSGGTVPHDHDDDYLSTTAKTTLTDNDGMGDANVVFNHKSGIPKQDGNSFRIKTNTDSSTDAVFTFEGKSGVTEGVSTTLDPFMLLGESEFSYKGQNIFHDGYHPNADKWTFGRTLALAGDVTGSVTWDGGENATITTTILNDSHTHDTRYIREFVMEDGDGVELSISQGKEIKFVDASGIDISWSNTAGGTDIDPYELSFSVLSAPKWETARTLTLSGDVTGSVSIDGSGDVSITTAVVDDSHTHDTRYIRNFILEDGDGTEVSITQGKEIKFVEGAGIDINWTDTSNGTDGDPYDLSFSVVSAPKWTTARTLTLTGDVTGSVSIDGSVNASITTVIANDSHTHDTRYIRNFVLEDGDGTEVSITQGKEIKFVEGAGIDINWTNTSNGTDGDPYDLSFNVVSAPKWTTPRTFTIGGDSQTVDGTSNETWTLSNMGALAYGTVSDGESMAGGVDSVAHSGIYQIVGSPTDGDSHAGQGDMLLHMQWGGIANATQVWTQMLLEYDYDAVWYRKKSGSGVSDWHRGFTDLYHPNADKWTTARTLSLTGDVTGSVSIDGSANKSITTVIANDSHTHDGRYYTEAESDSRFVNVTGDTITGTLNTKGINAVSTSANPFRWQRSSNTQVGQDDNVSVHVDDSAIYFTHNNDDDSDGSSYLFRYMSGGSAINMLAFDRTGITYKGQNMFRDDYHPNADKWTTARTLSLTGDVTGSVSWDGSANASITAVVANDSHNHHNQYQRIYRGTATGVTNAWKKVASVLGSGLGAIYDFTAVGTASSIVVSAYGTVVCNHWQDIHVKLTNGNYTTLSVKVTSNSDESSDLWVKASTSGTVNLSIEVRPLNNETVYIDSTLRYSGTTIEVTGKVGGTIDQTVGGSPSSYTASNFIGALTGNASTASKWTTARTLSLTGDVTGSVSIDGSANKSITTVVANDSHTHDGRYYTESESNSRFVNVTGDTMTGNLALGEDDGLRTGRVHHSVGGGQFATTTPVLTGAINVVLPQTWTNTMMHFFIDVYEYHTNTLFTVLVGGYNYASSSNWHNTSATIMGSASNQYNVRFGHNGTRCVVSIGESSTDWNYVQIKVRDFHHGYGDTTTSRWDDGWSINVGTLPSNIDTLITPQLCAANAAKWTTARTLSLTGDATGSVTFDGSSNASMAVSVSGGGGGSGSGFGIAKVDDHGSYYGHIFLGTDGKIYMNGYYSVGNLPTGGVGINSPGFMQIPLDYTSGVKDFYSNSRDSGVLMNDGRLYTWGYNGRGSCGVGNTSQVLKPTLVRSDVSEIHPSTNLSYGVDYHMTYIKTTSGNWYGFGSNNYGRLGDGSTGIISVPTLVGALPDGGTISKIFSLGGMYGATIVVSSKGKLYGSGYGGYGCLGTGASATYATWTAVDTSTGLVGSKIKDIKGGYRYYDSGLGNGAVTVFLTTDGFVYTCGHNAWASLGNGLVGGSDQKIPYKVAVSNVDSIHTNASSPLSVMCSHYDKQSLTVWGYNQSGGLGDGTVAHVGTPTNYSFPHKFIVGMEGGVNDYGYVPRFFAVKDDDSLYAVGDNANGVLMNGLNASDTGVNGWQRCEFYETGIKQVVSSKSGHADNGYVHILMNDGRLYGAGYNGTYNISSIFHDNVTSDRRLPIRMC